MEDPLIVIEACPNVKTRILTGNPQMLAVLGSHVQELSLYVYERYSSSISKALSLCTDLRHLYVSAEAVVLGHALSSPVPNLEVLETLVLDKDISLRRKELEHLGECVRNLHWLQVTVNCGDSEAFLGLKKVIEANLSLSHVDVYIKVLIRQIWKDYGDTGDYREYDKIVVAGEESICEILKVLLPSTSLREVMLDADDLKARWHKISAVKDVLAASLSKRRVDFEVLGANYAG